MATTSAKDSDRYRFANFIKAQPLFRCLARLGCGKVISVRVLTAATLAGLGAEGLGRGQESADLRRRIVDQQPQASVSNGRRAELAPIGWVRGLTDEIAGEADDVRPTGPVGLDDVAHEPRLDDPHSRIPYESKQRRRAPDHDRTGRRRARDRVDAPPGQPAHAVPRPLRRPAPEVNISRVGRYTPSP